MANEKRLIDANSYKASLTKWKEDAWKQNERGQAMLIADCLCELELMPTVEAIPIAVMKRAISGINAADQCDQAGRYDFELRNALKTVLKWYGSPAYKEVERRTNV